MLEKLKKWFVITAPDWLYSITLTLYWRLHPKWERILWLPCGNSWLTVRRDGSRIFSPKSVRLPFIMEPYERYFKVCPGETVLDVGACIGDFAIPAARKVREVIAIEPNPDNIAWLKRNITENRLQNVHIVEEAAWNRRGFRRLWIDEKNIGGHSLVRGAWGTSREKAWKIQADTLDNIALEAGIEKVDFMKMDIEGAEALAFQSCCFL